jgi:hypothetical protein
MGETLCFVHAVMIASADDPKAEAERIGRNMFPHPTKDKPFREMLLNIAQSTLANRMKSAPARVVMQGVH